MSEDKPWEPAPIPAEEFHQPGQQANINRAPYDVISGVIYKRAANIKRVRYDPLDAAPDAVESWQGSGAAVVRWLFSESGDTAEDIIAGADFLFLQDITLEPGASSGQQQHENELRILYAISGAGLLYHRACLGCPVVSRPLRVGDTALIQGSEYYSVANHDDNLPFRFFLVALSQS
jgi:hypothetical protein